MHVLGAWITKEKKKKLRFELLHPFLLEHGIELVHINDNNFNLRPESGNIQTLLYKIADSNLSSTDLHLSEKNFSLFLSSKPSAILFDDFIVTGILSDRIKTYYLLASFENKLPDNVSISKCVVLSNSFEDALAELSPSGSNHHSVFPLVCKPNNSSGGMTSHVMSLLFDQKQTEQAVNTLGSGTHSLQRFINHNSCLFKIYVIGCRVFIVRRPSIRNFNPDNYPTSAIEFHTSDVSKANSSSNLIGEMTDDKSVLDDDNDDVIKKIASVFVDHLKLSFFGIDVIIDTETQQWIIIDVNHFPGFEDLFQCYSCQFVFEQYLSVLKPVCLEHKSPHSYSIDDYIITRLPK